MPDVVLLVKLVASSAIPAVGLGLSALGKDSVRKVVVELSVLLLMPVLP